MKHLPPRPLNPKRRWLIAEYIFLVVFGSISCFAMHEYSAFASIALPVMLSLVPLSGDLAEEQVKRFRWMLLVPLTLWAIRFQVEFHRPHLYPVMGHVLDFVVLVFVVQTWWLAHKTGDEERARRKLMR